MLAGVGLVSFFFSFSFPFGFNPNSRTISEGIAEPRVISMGKTSFSEKTNVLPIKYPKTENWLPSFIFT